MPINCPYCGGKIKADKFLAMKAAGLSRKRQEIYKHVVSGGVEGVKFDALKEKFFPGNSDITVRTAIFGINARIAPARMYVKAGTVRVVP